jgi:hypothetical protein
MEPSSHSNGRNFTELLTPDTSPVMTSQASGNGIAVIDQITRENPFLLDGVVNAE